MSSYLLAGPEAEPLTLAEAKAFLRIDDSAEDGLIGALITAARLHLEAVTAKALLNQSWRLILDDWPRDRIVVLPIAPLISITSVTAYDADGAAQPIALEQFQSEATRLLLPPEIAGMPVLRKRQGIEIDFVAGYGSDAADVPADLRQALLVLTGFWFEHRDASAADTAPPASFERLLAPYRNVRL